MAAFISILLTLFVFTMTVSGVSSAVGPVGGPQYDISVAAQLLQASYLKVFNVPDFLVAPVSYLLLSLPAVLSFYAVQTLLPRKNNG